MKKKILVFIKSTFDAKVFFILLCGLLVRLILSPFGTLTLDQNTFIAWSNRLNEVGLGQFYFGSWSDYFPGYLYILNLVGRVAKFNLISNGILYKVPAILFDLGTGYLIYKIVFELKNKKWGVIAMALYLFNPAIIANSSLWGQVDGLVAFFSLLTIYKFRTSSFVSACALAFGTLVKPQMAIVSVVILVIMIIRKWKITKIVSYTLTSLFVFTLGFVPFSGGRGFASFIIERFNISLNQYPYTSVNAFNFWGLIGSWKIDEGLNIVGGVIVLILFLVVGVRFLREKGGEYILLAFSYGITFLFMTRMHERHLLPVFAPLTIAVAINPIFIFALLGFSFIYLANLYWAWVWITNNFQSVFSEGVIKILSLANVLTILFFVLPKKITGYFLGFAKLISGVGGNVGDKIFFQKAHELEKAKISSQQIKIIFIGVILFAGISRFYNLGSPGTHYFDEVYHAFTAQNMLHGVTNAWEWWNPNPEGFAYEWTHPPLAKEGMALGMALLGENAFGWRFPGALLGVGSLVLIFFIAKEIFGDELIGLLAATVFALDGLGLVLARIGMNDSYVLFFILATVLAYLKKKNFWSAIFLGLALATKWSALWTVPIIFVAHFVLKRRFNVSYLFYVVIPPLIYIASYFPIFVNKQIQTEFIANTYYETRTDRVSIVNPLGKTGIVTLDMFIDTQKQMWWYHTRLKATHPYTSLWYTWPFGVRPIYLYTSNEIDGKVARIYAGGNPIVFWGGIAAIAICAYFAIRERSKRLGLVVFCYLVFFTPWAMAPRIMFLYHYLPSIPFMAIASAYVLRRYRELTVPLLIIALILFAYFYSHWAGLTVPISLDTSYYWFSSWR